MNGTNMHTKIINLFFFLFFYIARSSSDDERYGTYIVHMDKSTIPAPFSTHHSWYAAILSSISTTQSEMSPIHLYTYKHVMDGFSVVLSKSQLGELEKTPGHIATYPDQLGELHTTHTPKFLGLAKNSGLWPAGVFGQDMIIGMFDSGIWPESESFNDHGMPPVPTRWNGACESGVQFNSSNCNRKLIGARSFSKAMKHAGVNISTTDDYDSARDYLGHGTHTSSTAAGSPVDDAEYFGYAKGTAIGIAPLARLAMYKVFFLNSTFETSGSDTLAAMDQAIEDGVDLMSLSMAFSEMPFYDNPIALGAFAAMEKGILVSCSAGNAGPHAYTIHNGAPWITTVGSGSVDREFVAQVSLGDGFAKIFGKSIYPGNLLVSGVSLYYGYGNTSRQTCEYNSLDSNDVSGKIVFCSFTDGGGVLTQMDEINRAGAIGGIFATEFAKFMRPDKFDGPFVAISAIDGEAVESYLSRTSEATVDIKFQITELGTKPAPEVSYSSSRGPNLRAPSVLKPDILAPGVDILAAWVPNKGLVKNGGGYFLSDYAIVSGTSMAAPHVVGIAALLKSAHPAWSPAAIRSAMMTTAEVVDNANGQIIDMTTGTSGTPLDFGAGFVNPNEALDPGLVYDIEAGEYVKFLCGLNYTSRQIQVITRSLNFTCEKATLDLNYPSFIVILNNTNTASYTFKRVLTNVADSSSVYRAVIWAPTGMKIVVEPMTLAFESMYSKAEFMMEVEVDVGGYHTESYLIGNYGYLSWHEVNGTHVVRSPIVSAFVP